MIAAWNPTPTPIARRYLGTYARQIGALRDCAALTESLVGSILKPLHLEIHQVSARAKALDSMRVKLRRKRYNNPETEVTDCIGVRVITYYAEDVDRVTDALKLEFAIDPNNSEDKRRLLDGDAFGYRSVHLIASLSGSRLTSPEYSSLRNQVFEIQVRSLLEHAWAEIEHEVKYKPRIDYPADFNRRFARIAGVLELLDTEFQELRSGRWELVDEFRNIYAAGRDAKVRFDSARLLGFLEAVRPTGLSWREAARQHRPFPLHVEASCVDALHTLRLDSAERFLPFLGTRAFKRKLQKFASIASVPPEKVSHFAIVLISVLNAAPSRLVDFFPAEICESAEIRTMRSGG